MSELITASSGKEAINLKNNAYINGEVVYEA